MLINHFSISSTEDSLATNLKAFWNFVHNKKLNISIPQTMTLGSESASNTQDICELLSKHFISIFEEPTLIRDDCETLENKICCNYDLSNLKLSELIVLNKLKKLDCRKDPDYDKMPVVFL